MLTFADRVAREDERRFVGRDREVARFEEMLAGRGPERVLIVHGPGGIGKSTLLRHLRRVGERAGREVRVVDGRDGIPTSAELSARLGGANGGHAPLIVLDTYERLRALGPLLRNELLLALPGDAIVVIALRGAPEPDWIQGGWERVTHTIALAPVTGIEARELLLREGIVDDDSARALLDWAAGSPLALSVGADALRGGGEWGARRLDDRPELARLLLRRLTDGELDSRPLDVAAVASIARRTDEALLSDVLPGVDGEAAAAWLGSLTFVEPLGGGMALHELVAGALRAEFRRLRPERERELRRRIAEHLYARASAGEIGLLPDLAELVDDEALRWGLGGEGPLGLRADDTGPHDLEGLAAGSAEAARRDADQWLESTISLIREAPRLALVARDDDSVMCGLCISVTPRNAPPAAERDPVLGPWLAHAREHQPDGNVLIWRDSLDFTERHGKRSSRVLAVMNSAAIMRSGLANPRCALLPIDPENAMAVEFARSVRAKRVDGLDVVLDKRRRECHLLDYGEGGLLAAHRATVYSELGLHPPVLGDDPGAGASTALSADVVKDAMRNIDRPLELARSPLAQGSDPLERADSVRRLIADAAENAFGAEPDERALAELVRRRYLGEPTTHELVADDLHVSRATYFRHLRVAMDHVAEYLLALSR